MSTAPPRARKTYTYYHAGPLFTLADLHTNTLLSRLIHQLSRSQSGASFTPLVPQDIEARDTSPHAIRDQDLRSLLAADVALFVFDGSELDAGTVVEFCVAKFADVPAVILRTDFRRAGDQNDGPGGGGGDPWNLMCSAWPRTVAVVIDSMAGYKAGLARAQGRLSIDASTEGVENVVSLDTGDGVNDAPMTAGNILLEETARRVVAAMNEVVAQPSVMPRELREGVWRWISLMPGFKEVGRDGQGEEVRKMLDLLKFKEDKGLY